MKEAKPDAVISFIDQINVYVLIATMGLGLPIIVSERVDPRHYHIGKMFEWLRRQLYPRAAALVVQTKSVATWASPYAKPDRISVIPNPVRMIPQGVAAAQRQKRIVAMGRFDCQKGFDILLRAFAKACGDGLTGWKLTILGDGRERPALESLAAELNIQHLVDMPGRVQNPESWLQESAIFVLSSRFEGFPNALIEAMSCGMSRVVVDCPSGPADIVEDGANGLLVPPQDEAKLAQGIMKLAADEALRQALGSRAAEIVHRSLAQVMAQWEATIGSRAS